MPPQISAHRLAVDERGREGELEREREKEKFHVL